MSTTITANHFVEGPEERPDPVGLPAGPEPAVSHLGADGGASAAGAPEAKSWAGNESALAGGSKRQPAIFVPHGGGPWPFVDLGGLLSQRDVEVMRAYFVRLPSLLPEAPRALLVVSAHWEERVPTVMTSAKPSIFYDYYGFPPESYAIEWPAPGHPALAERVVQVLEAAGIPVQRDPTRGFDHGTFIPFKLSWPAANVPTVQVSLQAGLDPDEHYALGRALAPLREEGVLLLGSGMSYHNMRGFGSTAAHAASVAFDDWLREAATLPSDQRQRALCSWASAPSAREAHPREEHLLPLLVMAGAAADDPGRVTFNEDWAKVRISAIQYG